ncbi:MAG: Lipopolysaccharide export system protein LptC [Pseudomonadota bacterium]
MKNPVFLLVFLLVGIGTLYVLMQKAISEGEPGSEVVAPRADYDYYIEDLLTTRFGSDGQVLSQLRATRVTHYPDGDRAELQAPRLTTFGEAQDEWQVSAETGTLAPDAERAEDRLDLRGAVELDKPMARSGTLAVRTTALSIYTDTQEAFTTEPVSISQGNTRYQGAGMRALLAEDYVSMNDGRGIHDPKSLP